MSARDGRRQLGFARTVGMLSDVGVFLGVVVGAFIFLV